MSQNPVSITFNVDALDFCCVKGSLGLGGLADLSQDLITFTGLCSTQFLS